MIDWEQEFGGFEHLPFRFEHYQTDNIKTPPVAKTLFQNIWEIFENMKTQKKTFENIFLEISKPWIDAREAREKFWGFLRRFTRENR